MGDWPVLAAGRGGPACPQPAAPVCTGPQGGRGVLWGGASGSPTPGEEPEASLAGHVFSYFRLPFPPGDRVTFNGKECVCQKCSLPKTAGGSVHLSQGLWSKWAPSGMGGVAGVRGVWGGLTTRTRVTGRGSAPAAGQAQEGNRGQKSPALPRLQTFAQPCPPPLHATPAFSPTPACLLQEASWPPPVLCLQRAPSH